MAHSLDQCLPISDQGSYGNFQRRPIKHNRRHKLKRGSTRPKRQGNLGGPGVWSHGKLELYVAKVFRKMSCK